MARNLRMISLILASAWALQPAAALAAPGPADARLKALYDGYSVWDAKESEVFLDAKGELKSTAHLPRVDVATQQRRAAHLKDLLDQLNAIPAAQLSSGEQVNAAVFRTLLENSISDARFRLWEIPFNSDSSFWTYLDSREPFEDAAEYQRYIARMRDVPRFFDEEIANMRAGLARGFSIPRVTLEGRDASISMFLVDDPRKSGFYKPFETMPATIPAADQARLRAEAAGAIDQAILPAYRKLLDFYRNEYLPKARTTIAARDLPEGDA